MQLSPFDIKVLTYIKANTDGRSMSDLETHFGPEISSALEQLLSFKLIRIHEHNIKPFIFDITYHDPPKGNYLIEPAGSLEIKRFSYSELLTRRQRWKERLWGFFSGVAVSFLGGLILAWFLGG